MEMCFSTSPFLYIYINMYISWEMGGENWKILYYRFVANIFLFLVWTYCVCPIYQPFFDKPKEMFAKKGFRGEKHFLKMEKLLAKTAIPLFIS